MQQRTFASHIAETARKPATVVTTAAPTQRPKEFQSKESRTRESRDDLTRIFNTAVISSKAETKRDLSTELQELTESPAFKAILNSVRQLAAVQGISERQSAEVIIDTFRKLDDVWNEYVLREGLDRIRRPRS